MFCHRCGKEIEDGSSFCIYCGTMMPQDDQNDNCFDIESYDAKTTKSNNVSNTEDNLETNKIDNVDSTDVPIKTTDNYGNTSIGTTNAKTLLLKVYDAETSKSRFSEQKKIENSTNTLKFYHNIKISLGKSTVICVIAFLIIILVSVCIYTCCQTSKGIVISHGNNFEESYKNTPASYENNEERWDAENCIYTNFKHGVAFTLPKDLVWHKVSGTAKHTIVKFVQPDTKLTLFVNIDPIQGESNTRDIWEIYDQFKYIISGFVKEKVNQNSAEQIKDFNFKKAVFCGKHAIKVRYNSVLGDDRYDKKIHLTTIDYTFINNNSTTTVTVKCFDEIIELFRDEGITMDDFLKSFQLTPKKE